MSILMTFPGQGTQRPNLISELPCHSEVESALQEVEEVLGYSPTKFDSLDENSSNRDVQLALTISGYVQYRYLKAHGVQPNYMMGLSIGAFTAAICSGILDLEHGLNIVSLRGELMAQAYPSGYGMAAIIGLSLNQVSDLVFQSREQGLCVYVANINSENTTILAGKLDDLEQTCEQAIKAQAHSARRLNVSVPSHCELLANQAEILYSEMQKVTLNRAKSIYVSTNRARVMHDVESIRRDLAFNMSRVVNLWDTLSMMGQRGVKLAMECSPGAVLTSLCQSSMNQTQCISLDSTSLDNTLEWVKRTR
ncbi:acyltransferase domain-containing protein [uncultured Vibrio sp.]|uniref:ACP S-malonyltransferase n=1 Tax=uncultured Vibrio sp. TaxID=114054 RepID=UPI002AAAF689|nr:acyltransferase domain-containing protein [uncultured Vibrio sp.]